MSWWRPDFPGQDAGIINDDWVIRKIKQLIDEMSSLKGNMDDLEKKFEELKNYVDNLPLDDLVKEQLRELINDGTISNILERLLFKGQSIEQGFSKPFAQCGRGYGDDGDTSKEGTQGFTIRGNMAAYMFTQSSDYTYIRILVYNLTSGVQLYNVQVPFDSHPNDIFWEDDVTVGVICSTGGHANNIAHINLAQSSITYETLPFVINGGNLAYSDTYKYIIYDLNYTFYGVKSDGTYDKFTNMFDAPSVALLTQGSSYHNGTLYMGASAWIQAGIQLVFALIFEIDETAKTVNLMHTYLFPNQSEIEGIDLFNGHVYGCFRTTGFAMTYELIIGPTVDTYYTTYQSKCMALLRIQANQHIYVNSIYNFFCDGSESKPFAMVNLTTDFIYPTVNQIIMHVNGDHKYETIQINSSIIRFYVYLENNCVIKNIIALRGFNVVIEADSTATVTGSADIEYVMKCNLRKLIFSGSSNNIVIAKSDVTLTDCDITGGQTKVITATDSRVFIDGAFTKSANNVFMGARTEYTLPPEITSNFPTMLANTPAGYNHLNPGVVPIVRDLSAPINEVLLTGRYYFDSSCSLTDAPSNCNKACALEVWNYNSGNYVYQRLLKLDIKGHELAYGRVVTTDGVASAWVMEFSNV